MTVENKAKMKWKVSNVVSFFFLCIFTVLSNHSHTILLSLWMQWPIRLVQMSHRWNAGVVFSAHANFSSREFSRHHKQQSEISE